MPTASTTRLVVLEKMLSSNTNSAEVSNTGITAFNSNGFTMGSAGGAINTNDAAPYVGWTFRKAAKFFDVVTWTGNSTAGRQIAHALGTTPGMIIVKGTSAGTAGFNWKVWHRSLPSSAYTLALNTTGAQVSDNGIWNSTAPTSSVFTVGADTSVNSSGETYVAYVFAHDDTTNGLIQCGSFTTDGSGNATVTLGWEPQFAILKLQSGVGNWVVVDAMRGMNQKTGGGSNGPYVTANTSNTETATGNNLSPTATGFQANGLTPSVSYIYMAIRRSNKPPTTGTQVFKAITRTGTDAAASVTGVGFAPDMAIIALRNSVPGYQGFVVDKLRGTPSSGNVLQTSTTNGETGLGTVTSLDIDGISFTNDIGGYGINGTGITTVNYFFKRAVGVFDVVCYKGTTAALTINHGLGVLPELVIFKLRDTSANSWVVHYGFTATNMSRFYLDLIDAAVNATYATFGSGSISSQPTATTISIASGVGELNKTNEFVAYLFASKAGISKIGTYTGNGTNQNIDCGFTAGARFVLIKRADASGDWTVIDTVRGIIAGNDPFLRLNTTDAEVINRDCIDPYSAGFNVVQETTSALNLNGATYIFLAFA